jgi:hypothetical protein
MWRKILTAALIVAIPSIGWAAEARNPRVSPQTYQDCRRFPQKCAGDDRARTRRDYYRNNTRQGSGYGVYRGQRRIWSDKAE